MICALCWHSGRGYGFQLRLDQALPHYAACSMACLDGIAALTDNFGRIDMQQITDMEKEAIFEARRAMYKALVKCGSVDVEIDSYPGEHPQKITTDIIVSNIFASLSAEQIDSIIVAVWDQLRATMQRLSAQGNVPFPLSVGATSPSSNGASTSTAAPLASSPPPLATGRRREELDDEIPF